MSEPQDSNVKTKKSSNPLEDILNSTEPQVSNVKTKESSNPFKDIPDSTEPQISNVKTKESSSLLEEYLGLASNDSSAAECEEVHPEQPETHTSEDSDPAAECEEVHPEQPEEDELDFSLICSKELRAVIHSFIDAYSPEYFQDSFREKYIKLNYDELAPENYSLLKINSDELKDTIKSFCYTTLMLPLSVKKLNEAIGYFESLALNGEHTKINVRVAEQGDNILYNLGRGTISICANSWMSLTVDTLYGDDTEGTRTLFYHTGNQERQVAPTCSDIQVLDDIFNFVNIREEKRLLFKIVLISALVPNIMHPIMYIHGNGSLGKTVTSSVIKKLLDPSRNPLLNLKKKEDEYRKLIRDNWCLVFDNVTNISSEQSEILCRVITDDTVNLGCIVINGRKMLAKSDELLSRTILFDMDTNLSMRGQNELMRDFESQRPPILGAMFDALAQAMARYSGVVAPGLHRLVDFERWGMAIGDSLELGGGQRFLDLIHEEARDRSQEIISRDPLGSKVQAFINSSSGLWAGSATELLTSLDLFCFDDWHSVSGRPLPSDPNVLSRQLREISTHLQNVGIIFSTERTSTSRLITLRLIRQE